MVIRYQQYLDGHTNAWNKYTIFAECIFLDGCMHGFVPIRLCSSLFVACADWVVEARGIAGHRSFHFNFCILYHLKYPIWGSKHLFTVYAFFFLICCVGLSKTMNKWTGRTIFVHLHGPAKPSISESSTSWLRMSWWMQYNLQHQNWERKHQRRSSWTTSSRAGTDLCPLLPIVKCSNSVNKKDMWRRFARAAVVMQQCAWCL